MAYRFVRARPLRQRLPELRERLERGDIEQMEPFGQAMTKALQNARFDPETGEAVWIEEEYCTPPLAMERAEILDDVVFLVDDDADLAPVLAEDNSRFQILARGNPTATERVFWDI